MRLKRESSGTIAGVLLPLGMVCLFAFCSLILLMTGLQVYQNMRTSSDNAFGSSVAYSYLHTKLSQNNTMGAVSIRKEGGVDVLVIDHGGEAPYETRIYYGAGRLREQFVEAGQPFDSQSGTAIAPASYVGFLLEDNLLLADFVTDKEESIHMTFALVGGGG